MSKPTIEEIANTQKIPSLSAVAMRLLDIAQQENPDFREVSRILRTDPAISGKILKTVNSALYGFRSKIESIDQAIPKLGLSMIRTLILGFHLSDSVTKNDADEQLFQKLWRSSLTQAVIAELLAEKLRADSASYFSAGMLQDIGIQALATECYEEYREHVLPNAELPEVCQAETAYFGFNHIDVTIQILKNWNLGEQFINAVRTHHRRSVGDDKPSKMQLALQAASMGARILNSMQESGRISKSSLGGRMEAWAAFMCSELGLTTEQIEELVDEVFERVEEYSVLFSFDLDEISPDAVTRKAKMMLQEIAVDLQLRLVENRKGNLDAEIESQLFNDYLTGLYNQRFLHEKLRDQLSDWIQAKQPVVLMYVDIDDFKSVNDNHGHRVGDDTLKHVSNWLTTCTRSTDFSIRLGGDEFLVVAQAAEENYQAIAERIAQGIPPLELNDQSLTLTLSVGCVFCSPDCGEKVDLDWLIDQADNQMYSVKNNGKASLSIQSYPSASTTAASASTLET